MQDNTGVPMPMSLTKHIKGKIAPDNDDDARTGPICECVVCVACDDLTDDLDKIDKCPSCNGRGITEVCQSCTEAEEDL